MARDGYEPLITHGGEGYDDDDDPPPTHVEMGILDGADAPTQCGRQKWTDLDAFFTKVYNYFNGKGFLCILIGRVLNLAVLAFIVCFSVFLLAGIDYDVLFTTYDFSSAVDIRQLRRMNPAIIVGLVFFGVFWLWQLLALIADTRDLLEMRRFYSSELGIVEADMETVQWSEIVRRLCVVQEKKQMCIQKATLSAHDIANRIMRKENYLIALFNKEVLDISLTIPLLGRRIWLPKSLEWNISRAILDYVFDTKMSKVKDRFLHSERAPKLADGLRKRFMYLGAINLVLSPFILVFTSIYFFFRYFQEFRSQPNALGVRQWTPYARWRFREFNELPHIFQTRLNLSSRPAEKYLSRFSSQMLATIARFLAFVVGAFIATLTLMGAYDENFFIKVHLTQDRSVLFYLTVFGGIFAICRALIPPEDLVFDPEGLMRTVVFHTHYFPHSWRGKVHTHTVRDEFAQLYEFKIVLFLTEVFGVFITPFVLWFRLPKCSKQIVDFFKDFTVDEHGIGHVCSFALFDFKKHGNRMYGAPAPDVAPSDYQLTDQGKMEKSFINFKANNPEWQPSQEGQAFLGRLHTMNAIPPDAAGMGANSMSQSLLVGSDGRLVAVRSPLGLRGADTFARYDGIQVGGSVFFPPDLPRTPTFPVTSNPPTTSGETPTVLVDESTLRAGASARTNTLPGIPESMLASEGGSEVAYDHLGLSALLLERVYEMNAFGH
eukprot:Opistho-2@21063